MFILEIMLIAIIVIVVLSIVLHRQRRQLRKLALIRDLVLLRVGFDELEQSGHITEAERTALRRDAEQALMQAIYEAGKRPVMEQVKIGRWAAWKYMVAYLGRSKQAPPWMGDGASPTADKKAASPPKPPAAPIPATAQTPAPAIPSKTALMSKVARTLKVREKVTGMAASVGRALIDAKEVAPSQPPVTAKLRQPSVGEPASTQPRPSSQPKPSGSERAADFALSPQKPGALEVAFRKVSGWSRLLVPFLVQNIGWFISSFFFVTGSLFLITCTTGLTRSLVVALSLVTYTLLMLIGAYQLRKRRPELITAARVLSILGMLLIPLAVAASVRLADIHFAVGIGLSVASVVLFGWAARLTSGLVERTLGGHHARIFAIFTAVHLMVPLVVRFPSWPVLALMHILITGILGYALIRFVRNDLPSLILDRTFSAWFGVGTLIYAAGAAVLHLTWRFPAPLPAGYFGPFVMLLAGFLFFVDARIKQLARSFAWMSRFTVGIYAVSALGLLISLAGPVPRLAALSIGAAVYATVIWRYLTLTPLWMMLACLFGLYGFTVLAPLSPKVHFLAALPGLAMLWGMQRFAVKRRSETLAGALFRVRLITGVVLAGWSLWHGTGTPAALVTGMLLTAWLYAELRFTSLGLFRASATGIPARRGDLRETRLFYAIPASVILTLLVAPPWIIADGMLRFAGGLLIAASVWLVSGLHQMNRGHSDARKRGAVLLDSTLIAVALSVMAAVARIDLSFRFWGAIPLFAVGAGILLWMGIALRDRFSVYPGLILAGVAGALAKQTWFPGPSTGLVEMTLCLVIWGFQWRIERVHAVRRGLVGAAGIAANQPEIVLLGWHAVSPQPLARMLALPARIAMAVLWGFGMLRLGTYAVTEWWAAAWSLSAAFGAMTAFLMVVRERRPKLTVVPLMLGLATILVPMVDLVGFRAHWLSFLICGYGFLVWRFAKAAADRPLTARIPGFLLPVCEKPADHFTGIGRAVHSTASGMIGLAVLLSSSFWMVQPTLNVLPGFAVALLFFHMSGNETRRKSHTHDVLALLGAAALAVHTAVLGITDTAFLPTDARTGLTAALFGLMLMGGRRILDHAASGREGAAIAAARYRKPLQMAAFGCGVTAGIQQIWLAFGMVANVIPAASLVAGICLLIAGWRANFRWRCLPGVVLITHALICGFLLVAYPGAAVHPWPVDRGVWLFIAGMGAVMGALSVQARLPGELRRSIHLMGMVLVSWAGARAVPLTAGILAGGVPTPGILSFLGILFVALFLVATPLRHAGRIRGIGFICIGTAGVMGGVAMIVIPQAIAAVGWGFLLLAIRPLIRRFNQRHGRWIVRTETWPWAGLVLVTVYAPLSLGPEVFGKGIYWLAVAAWLFLAMRDWKHPVLAWSATGVLTIAGVLCWWGAVARQVHPLVTAAGMLGWANLLLIAGAVRNATASAFLTRAGWRLPDLGRPFRFWGGLVILLSLILLIGLQSIFLTVLPNENAHGFMMGFAAMVTLSLVHFQHRVRRRFIAHAVILGALSLLIAVYGAAFERPSWPLFMALWTGLLLTMDRLKERIAGAEGLRRAILNASHGWLPVSPWMALVGLIFLPVTSFAATVVALGLLAGIMGGIGWPRHNSILSHTGRLLGLVFLHVWPMAFLPARKGPAIALWEIGPLLMAQFERFQLLFPWVALELALISWAVVGLIRLMHRYPVKRFHLRNRALTFLAMAELSLHMILSIRDMAAGLSPANTWLQALAAMVAAGLLAALLIRNFQTSHRPIWVYLTGSLAGLGAVYLRCLIAGGGSVTGGESLVLMTVAWGMSLWGRVASTPALTRPLNRISMAMWVPILFTASWHWGSGHATTVLLSAGAFCLFYHRITGRSRYLYSGALLLNAALYLWIPAWSHATRLCQLYLIPVAVTVLAILQLHRKELRPGVLNGCRLAALCLIYVGASLDLFLRPGLLGFVLALAAGLSGVGVGIALKIRAFLYGGVIFVVVNVMGQLIRFYPQHSLGKGIVLVATGAAILSIMIWFSARREEIMKHIRLIRADLAAWE